MDCKEWRKTLKIWLSDNWLHNNDGNDIPDSLKLHAENCPECRMRLKSTGILIQNTGFQKPVPAGLSDRISKNILGQNIQRRTRHKQWMLVPLAAAAIVLITFLFTLRFFIQSPQIIVVHLKLDVPDATSVSVVGDWNSWNPDIDILSDQDGDGVWDIKLKLKKNNEYRYQFLINGKEWIPDPASPLQVDDGFGGINSILEI